MIVKLSKEVPSESELILGPLFNPIWSDIRLWDDHDPLYYIEDCQIFTRGIDMVLAFINQAK